MAVDLRQLVAAALHSSDLGDDPTRETPLDRILAMAHADRLGGLLWRLRLANDAAAFAPATLIVSRRLRRGTDRRSRAEIFDRVAARAVQEWLDDLCRVCLGRGKLVAKDTPVATHVCVRCSGTGRRRHSDAERARAIGLSMDAARKWTPKFALAHEIIADADAGAGLEVAAQLGRISGRRTVVRGSVSSANSRGILALVDTPLGATGCSGRPGHNDNQIPEQSTDSPPGRHTNNQMADGRVQLEPGQSSTRSPSENAHEPALARVLALDGGGQ